MPQRYSLCFEVFLKLSKPCTGATSNLTKAASFSIPSNSLLTYWQTCDLQWPVSSTHTVMVRGGRCVLVSTGNSHQTLHYALRALSGHSLVESNYLLWPSFTLCSWQRTQQLSQTCAVNWPHLWWHCACAWCAELTVGLHVRNGLGEFELRRAPGSNPG
jgi:hypothetical protein